METVGAYEAKTHLFALITEVERGEVVTITRHGGPVARLVPAVESARPAGDVVTELLEHRKGAWHGEATIRDMIADGRRR